MKHVAFLKKILEVFIGLFFLISIVLLFFIIFNKAYFTTSFKIDSDLAAKFGSFFGGFVGTIFTILSILLLIYTILIQNIEKRKDSLKSNFFKMIDYHNDNVRQMNVAHIDSKKTNIYKGRMAFVIFKLQIKKLLEYIKKINEKHNLEFKESEILDITYTCFFYGLDQRWKDFIYDKLEIYPQRVILIEELLKELKNNKKLSVGRTNQTNLSTYFRNIFNLIKLIDKSPILNDEEKIDLIKIFRAQLSNPELYIIFYNLASRFGLRWRIKTNQYVTKYKLIKNLPKNYCDCFDPKDYFDIVYEYEYENELIQKNNNA